MGAEILSVARHSLIYVVGQALSRAVGFLMIPIYTHYIAPKNYGAMELIEIIGAAIMMIISMGVADTMSRFYYAENDLSARNRIVSTTIIGFACIGIPVVLVFVAFSQHLSALVLEEPQYRYYLQVAIVTVWFGMLCEVGYTYLRMRYMAKLFVSITIAQLVAALSLNIYLVVYLRLDILGVFYSTLITQGLTGGILSSVILKRVGFSLSGQVLVRLVRFGLPLVPSRIGLMLGFVSNRFFLRWMGSPDPTIALAQVGLFSLGHKFAVVINRFVNVPFNSFWGPRRLELLLSGTAGSREIAARVCTYATTLSLLCALVLSTGIESLIEIIADPRYKGAHVVVPFVALAYVVLGLETHFMSGILCTGRTFSVTLVSIVGIGVVLVWNFIFVPIYGLIGAATSNLAAFVVRLALIYVISQRRFPIPFEGRRLATIFVVAFLLFLVSQIVTLSSPFLTFLIRVGFVAVFPLVLFFTGFYTKAEIDAGRRVVRRGVNLIEACYPGCKRA